MFPYTIYLTKIGITIYIITRNQMHFNSMIISPHRLFGCLVAMNMPKIALFNMTCFQYIQNSRTRHISVYRRIMQKTQSAAHWHLCLAASFKDATKRPTSLLTIFTSSSVSEFVKPASCSANSNILYNISIVM